MVGFLSATAVMTMSSYMLPAKLDAWRGPGHMQPVEVHISRTVMNAEGTGELELRPARSLQKPPPRRVAASNPVAIEHRRALLLCTHGQLMWLDTQTGEVTTLHTGRGVYYGAFPGEAGTVWVVSRPHNWRPVDTVEALLHIDGTTGELLEEKQIPTRFTHDAVRSGDHVYLADTGNGRIVVLAYPSMDVVKHLQPFTARQHVNTLAVLAGVPGGDDLQDKSTHVWAVLHNLGKSLLVQVDMDTGKWQRELTEVGYKTHGCVFWRNKMVMLNSGEGELILVDPSTPDAPPVVLWRDPDQTFMKGLTVLEDVAYFGISQFGTRAIRDSPDKTSDVAAFDLLERKLLWRRTVETKGLLNVVSAPQVSEGSTFLAVDSWGGSASRGAAKKKEVDRSETAYADAQGPLDSGEPLHKLSASAPPLAPPLIPLAEKQEAYQNRREHKDSTGPFKVEITTVDVSAIQAMLTEEVWDPTWQKLHNAALTGRESNLKHFKPGVATAHLFFSDRFGETLYEFPLWEHFEPTVKPVIDAILGMYGLANPHDHIVRLQFARMLPNAHIKPHFDSGPWVMRTHRVHIPIIVNRQYRFQVHRADGWANIETEEGGVFEINNAIMHQVTNEGPNERVHLLLDWSETARPNAFTKLRAGQECRYAGNAAFECA